MTDLYAAGRVDLVTKTSNVPHRKFGYGIPGSSKGGIVVSCRIRHDSICGRERSVGRRSINRTDKQGSCKQRVQWRS